MWKKWDTSESLDLLWSVVTTGGRCIPRQYETMGMCAKEMMIDKKFRPEGAVICLHSLAAHVSLSPAEIKGDYWLVDIFLHNERIQLAGGCWVLAPFCRGSWWNYTKKRSAEVWRKVEIMKVLSRKCDLVKKRGSVGFLAEEVGHGY